MFDPSAAPPYTVPPQFVYVPFDSLKYHINYLMPYIEIVTAFTINKVFDITLSLAFCLYFKA